LILLMAILMAGCETQPTRIHYSNPTATYERFADVSYQCVKNVQKVITAKSGGYGEVIPEQVEVDCDRFNACMSKYGFTKSPDGEFLTQKTCNSSATDGLDVFDKQGSNH
jgi:hypothetical protein